MGKRLLLAGYLGAGNLGDDAMMLGLVHGLRDTSYEYQVLSASPDDTYRLYGMVSHRRDDAKAVSEAIDNCDALVFAGGSIFQDSTSVGSVLRYSDLVHKAKKKGKQVLLMAQGVGPLTTMIGKHSARKAFEAADVVAVRDPTSLNLIQQLGVKRKVHVAADTAFLLPQPNMEGDEFTVGTMKSIGIAPRPLKDRSRDIVGLFGEFARLVYQAGYMPVLIEMDAKEDGPLILAISKKQGGKIPDLRRLVTPMQLQQRLGRLQAVVAMRLHAGVLAATVGVPPMMVNYDPKVAAFAKLLDVGNAVPIEGMTSARLMDSFISFMKDRDRNGKILLRKRDELISAAQVNATLVREALG